MQSYKDMEILCLDNQSSDHSMDMVREFASSDDRVRITHLSRKYNPYETKNLAVDMANGKYILFANVKDRYKDSAFSEMVGKLKVVNSDLVVCDVDTVRELDISNVEKYKLVFEGAKKANYVVLKSMNLFLYNKMFKLELVKKYDIKFFSSIYANENFVMKYLSVCRNIEFYKSNLVTHNIKYDPIERMDKQAIEKVTITGDLYNFIKRNVLLRGDLVRYYVKMFSTNAQYALSYGYDRMQTIGYIDKIARLSNYDYMLNEIEYEDRKNEIRNREKVENENREETIKIKDSKKEKIEEEPKREKKESEEEPKEPKDEEVDKKSKKKAEKEEKRAEKKKKAEEKNRDKKVKKEKSKVTKEDDKPL